jgi:hypothetical protein
MVVGGVLPSRTHVFRSRRVVDVAGGAVVQRLAAKHLPEQVPEDLRGQYADPEVPDKIYPLDLSVLTFGKLAAPATARFLVTKSSARPGFCQSRYLSGNPCCDFRRCNPDERGPIRVRQPSPSDRVLATTLGAGSLRSSMRT